MTTASKTTACIHLRRFRPDKVLTGSFNMVVLGHKHTGKSTLMKDILYHLHQNKIPRVVVFSGTEEGNDFYQRFVPASYIHAGLDLDRLKTVVDAQRKIVKSCRSMEGRCEPIDTRLVIVLDDIMYKKHATKTEIFGELFMNGRHWNVSILLSCQYIMLLDVACRSNVDYLVCLREQVPRNRQKLYENFFGMFSRRQDFYHVLDECTKNYEALILDNTSPNLTVESCVLWYKASLELPSFRFGSGSFQQYSSTSR